LAFYDKDTTQRMILQRDCHGFTDEILKKKKKKNATDSRMNA